MNGYIHCVFVLVCNLYHLLIAARLPSITGWTGGGSVDRNADKSSETSYTVVNMNDVVSDGKLLQFLKRECHLTLTCFVALKVVFMEAVEYLMVGEQTEVEGVVDESCMNCATHRFKGYSMT